MQKKSLKEIEEESQKLLYKVIEFADVHLSKLDFIKIEKLPNMKYESTHVCIKKSSYNDKFYCSLPYLCISRNADGHIQAIKFSTSSSSNIITSDNYESIKNWIEENFSTYYSKIENQFYKENEKLKKRNSNLIKINNELRNTISFYKKNEKLKKRNSNLIKINNELRDTISFIKEKIEMIINSHKRKWKSWRITKDEYNKKANALRAEQHNIDF